MWPFWLHCSCRCAIFDGALFVTNLVLNTLSIVSAGQATFGDYHEDMHGHGWLQYVDVGVHVHVKSYAMLF